MVTTIQLDVAVRERLKAHGTAGMTYNEILTRLMDHVDREAFLAQTRREIEQADRDRSWVDLDDA